MKLKLLTLAFISLLVSCGSGETLADKDIDPTLRKTIKVKNDSLLAAITDADYDAIEKLAAPGFEKIIYSKLGSSNLSQAKRGGLLDNDKCSIVHEYYSRHDDTFGSHTITDEKEQYAFTYTYKEKETYVCMLKTTLYDVEDYILTTRYGLIDGQWKLTDMNFGFYGVYGKNAQDFYELAEKADSEDFDLDAYMYYDAANSLKDPCNKMLRYNNSEDMETKSKNTHQKLAMKYKFPKTLENITTHPEVRGIAPIKNAKGLYPIISYVSIIPVTDTAALTKEYNKVKAEVRKEYPGINYNKDFIYYRAYNQYSGEYHTFEDMRKKQ